jgi:hypothetical protein
MTSVTKSVDVSLWKNAVSPNPPTPKIDNCDDVYINKLRNENYILYLSIELKIWSNEYSCIDTYIPSGFSRPSTSCSISSNHVYK